MANPPIFHLYPTPEMADFYSALGLALSSWAQIEHELCKWFTTTSNIRPGLANDLFFSANAFRGRSELMRAAIANAETNADVTEFAEAVLLKAETYSLFRNDFVHADAPTLDNGKPTLLRPYGAMSIDKYKDGIGASHLRQAAANFHALATIMSEAHLGEVIKGLALDRFPDLAAPLPILRARVEQLPSDAGSNELSRKQKGRQRQRQAAQKSPIPKRSNGKGP